MKRKLTSDVEDDPCNNPARFGCIHSSDLREKD